MVEYDRDDPTPPVKRRIGQYWYVFKITFPTNVVWLILYILAFTFLVPALSRGQEVEQGTGLVCDTAEQVEEWVTLHNTGMKNPEVFAEINKDKDVCMVLTAAFYRGTTVKRVTADGLVYEIAPILVIGIFTGQWVQVSSNQIFSIFRSKDGGA